MNHNDLFRTLLEKPKPPRRLKRRAYARRLSKNARRALCRNQASYVDARRCMQNAAKAAEDFVTAKLRETSVLGRISPMTKKVVPLPLDMKHDPSNVNTVMKEAQQKLYEYCRVPPSMLQNTYGDGLPAASQIREERLRRASENELLRYRARPLHRGTRP